MNIDGISPCGVPCFACGSYLKDTCKGCRAEKQQKRKSKWGCKIRLCALKEKNLRFCSECEQFPCKEVNRKLINSHPNDKKYSYRHEIPENFKLIETLGMEQGLKELDKRWQCPECGGRILFYAYTCSSCGQQFLEK